MTRDEEPAAVEAAQDAQKTLTMNVAMTAATCTATADGKRSAEEYQQPTSALLDSGT